MSASDIYSKQLWNSATYFFECAQTESGKPKQQAFYRASFFHAFAFLESQVALIGEHFKSSPVMTPHEKAMLLERVVKFRSGGFHLATGVKFYNLEEKMELLVRKFSDELITENIWWHPLKISIDIRNTIAHPKADIDLKKADVRIALEAVLACVSSLYLSVFEKKLPYTSLGISSTWG